MTTYTINDDGPESTIVRTEKEPDGFDNFNTFRQAKRELLHRLRDRRDDFADAARRIRMTKIDELEER